MRLVLASQNEGKLKEMRQLLSAFGVEVVLQTELGVKVDVEETGETFAENAKLKALAVQKATGLASIADDSGLMVDALGGGPGVYTARYGGDGLSDEQRYRLLLSSLTGQTNRAAHFVCAICCAFPNGDLLTAEGECGGVISFAPMGEGGFGYDPVFMVPQMKKTFAQMTEEEKNSVSHRAKALKAFAEQFAAYNGKDGASC